jgi:ketosteroid isomerase-like protein
MVIPGLGLVGQFLRVIMQPKSIFRIPPPSNPNFRMIAVRNLVGLALCFAVADRAARSPPDPSGPIASETEPTKSVNQEITNLLKAYENALNSHDPKAVMALYGSDPIFIPQNAEASIGREAVQARYQRGSQLIKVNVVFTIHEIVEMGDLAYGRTTSVGQQEVLATHKISLEANNELFIFRREQGQWKIHRYMFAASNPPAAN